ncbi:hypothetical protein LG71_08005 [Pluralibacter gergoviae]|uniref:DUF805 domain-containing protein n=1 Tax=Pluralibacter gergoviae TaxID=61647 RepID=UPI0004F8DC43|nr:DUF805 domain-containing protein [Pluralibacter gergoviae]AIQ99839.1 hypothetical protein LG71_08005 [Pluralibacter gergoviae]
MYWYLNVLKNYVGFSGRARRREYFIFNLISVLIMALLGVVDTMSGGGSFGMLELIYSLLILLPSLAVLSRRLHDTDRSAWWMLILLIPFIGCLILFIFNCQKGSPGNNRYGPEPASAQSL